MLTPVLSELAALAAMAALFWTVADERTAGRAPFTSLARRWFGVAGTTAATILVALGAGVMLVVLPLTPDLVRGAERQPGSTPVAGVVLTVIAKLLLVTSEEVSFRGALLDQLRARLGTTQAVVACALCFGLAQGVVPGESAGAPAVMSTIVAGLGYGAATVFTGSLWTAVTWHAAQDLTMWQLTSLSALQFASGTFAYGNGPMQATIEDVAWGAAVVAFAIPLLWLLARRAPDAT